MSVAGPSRRLPSCRRRKRLRPGVGWWGSPVRFIVDLGCGYPFLVWFVFLWLLFSGVWETLIFGTGDWFAFGEPFFCGLFTPTNPLPGHRLVPESHFLSILGLSAQVHRRLCGKATKTRRPCRGLQLSSLVSLTQWSVWRKFGTTGRHDDCRQ